MANDKLITTYGLRPGMALIVPGVFMMAKVPVDPDPGVYWSRDVNGNRIIVDIDLGLGQWVYAQKISLYGIHLEAASDVLRTILMGKVVRSIRLRISVWGGLLWFMLGKQMGLGSMSQVAVLIAGSTTNDNQRSANQCDDCRSAGWWPGCCSVPMSQSR